MLPNSFVRPSSYWSCCPATTDQPSPLYSTVIPGWGSRCTFAEVLQCLEPWLKGKKLGWDWLWMHFHCICLTFFFFGQDLRITKGKADGSRLAGGKWWMGSIPAIAHIFSPVNHPWYHFAAEKKQHDSWGLEIELSHITSNSSLKQKCDRSWL